MSNWWYPQQIQFSLIPKCLAKWQISSFWWYESLGSDLKKSKCAFYGKTTVKKYTKYNMELYDYCFSAFHELTEWSSIDFIGTTFVFFFIFCLCRLFAWSIELLWRMLFERHERFIVLWVVIVVILILALIPDQNFDRYKEGSIRQDDYYVILTETYQIFTFVFIW